MFRTFSLTLAALAVMGLAGAMTPADAGWSGGGHGKGGHSGGHGKGGFCPPSKPGGNIHIYKPINIHTSVRINKSIRINKPIRINKQIIINKGGSSDALAIANAAASSQSAASAVALASGGSAIVDVAAPSGGGDFGTFAAEEQCVEQWAVVVKSIHAECVDRRGSHHPATRMRPETWVDSSMNAEIYRCLAGSRLKVLIGDVVESDHGVAGVYQGAQTLECKAGEALRHYRDGAVKCAVQESVPDCTERRNMRRYGLGDLFFSYHAKVCAHVAAATAARYSRASAAATGRTEVEVEGSFSGGVGN